MPYKDKEKQKEYQRQWAAKRRADFFNGKVCVVCKSQRNLELDHIDPKKKVSHNIWSWSDDKRNKELAKCQVLCNSCHKAKNKTDGSIPRGEKSNQSSLTDKDVIEMRELFDSGKMTVMQLSRKYGIKHPNVSKIVRRKAWTHLQ
ncbi:HNH endonuclease [Streptomyces phage Emma1919]|nr:HNH endonuclease [Streptomyces phage Emma1919]